uniref:TIP41-like protein n=1 Tax=Acrobeloides nanus TaxID=290746 RepID=A0A914E158_9BILA
MQRAMSSAKNEERHIFDNSIVFIVVKDHILTSTCRHADGVECQLCLYEKELKLPHLPEMIFPNNTLTILLKSHPNEFFIQFNTFDALKRVNATAAPDVQVGPSAVWKEARKDAHIKESEHPYDWTYTSDYDGTLGPYVQVEPTEERIDLEKLKRKDPIHFYAQLSLYEDELHDHGIAEMTIRVRVMPTCFFVLCRFYLRIDHVMVRVCDTRLFGEIGQDYVLREWSLREAKYSELSPQDLENVLDPNVIWQALPLLTVKSTKLYPSK